MIFSTIVYSVDEGIQIVFVYPRPRVPLCALDAYSNIVRDAEA